jgi:hypothetical protein
MKARSKHLYALAIALLFSWLFFERSAGINLLLFDLLLLAAIWRLNRESLHAPAVKLFYAGTLLSSIMVVWHNSSWSLLIHHINFGLLGGALAAPQLKSVFNVFFAGLFNVVLSIREFFRTRKVSTQAKVPLKRKPLIRFWYVLRISVIPLLAVLIFGTIYSNASPWFNTVWQNVSVFFSNIFGDFFNMISFTWFFTFIFGLILSIYLLFAKSSDQFEDMEEKQPDDLERKRDTYRGNALGLRRELHAATLLFVALNLMLLIQNMLDFGNVWIGFEWNGEYLKQFVHEGTYLLIFSIILSAGLVIFYFRGNLNFFKKNKNLKILAHIWIFQNMFLAASVAVRNIWYIDYFNLAYKRIGVFFFLLAVIYGLYTVYVKVNRKKSIHYLVRVNAMAVYLLLLTSSFVNWDVLITRYNFAHAEEGYIHLNFLVKMNDASLPDLKHDVAYLQAVTQKQEATYGRDKNALSPEEFANRIDGRSDWFVEQYTERDWLEWNYADWRAYKNLQSD